MADKLSIVNQALIRIGAEPIASFDDGDAQSLVASTLFDTISGALLSETPWHFALAGFNMAKIVPTPGTYRMMVDRYDYMYQLPADTIRVLGLESRCEFRLAGSQLFTNDSPARLVYVANVPPSAWRDYFTNLVVHELAASFAISITDTASRADTYKAYVREMKPRAMAIDAQQTPPEVFDLMRLYTRQSYNPLAGA